MTCKDFVKIVDAFNVIPDINDDNEIVLPMDDSFFKLDEDEKVCLDVYKEDEGKDTYYYHFTISYESTVRHKLLFFYTTRDKEEFEWLLHKRSYLDAAYIAAMHELFCMLLLNEHNRENNSKNITSK